MSRSLRPLQTLILSSTVALTLGAHAIQSGQQGPELLSELMQRLSTTAAFREKVLDATRSVPKIGEWLSPSMVELLRSAILGKDWQRVDHFPAFSIGALNQSVDLTIQAAGDSSKRLAVIDLIDLGSYDPAQAMTVDLDQPVDHPTYAEDPATAVTHPAPGLTMGDGPDPLLAPLHAQSVRLAQVLNRLSLNRPQGKLLTVRLNQQNVTDPGALIKVMQGAGYQVTVDDDLYFANFGHLHDGARDVMMPFWLDSQIAVPGTRRSLLIPVSHSEHELHVRGPHLNADVSYYFGIDGKSEFRTMDSLNQPWVMHRAAFSYKGDRAAEAINLLAQATRIYLAAHLAHPELPFGGYYKLGVCQDINAALEQKLQGRVILFPLTRDLQYFPIDPTQLRLGPRDREFLQLLHQIPNDRGSARPAVNRVLGALPSDDLKAIVVPGLADDLIRVERARSLGLIERTNPLLTAIFVAFFGLILASALLWAIWKAVLVTIHTRK